MTMKSSARRVLLRQAQTLLNQLISINEEASVNAANLIAAGASADNTVNLILAAGGPAATADTISAELEDIIDGTTGNIDWLYEVE